MKSDRKLRWISAVDPANHSLLTDLQSRMQDFYAGSKSYYGDVDFTSQNWIEHPIYRDIVQRISGRGAIVEVGCGSANILRHSPEFSSRYSGCDFSPERLATNRISYPEATFSEITNPRKLPFPDESADAVFSVFVIEHAVYPQDFLLECHRVLRPGGVLILLCPDFLGASRMSSQCAGFGFGTGSQKLKKGRLLDAVVTGYDRKIRIPRRCAELRAQIGNQFGFYINLAPVCFEYPFAADHDAVYLTYSAEMKNFLREKVTFEDTRSVANEPGLIYLVGVKG